MFTTSALTKTNLPRGTDGASMVPAKVQIEPADDDRHCAEAAHDNQKERCVLHMRLVVYREEDRKANDGNADRDYGEGEPMLCLVGQVCNDHCKREGTCPRGNAVQLGADRGVSITVQEMLFRGRRVRKGETQEPSNNSRCKKSVAGSKSVLNL